MSLLGTIPAAVSFKIDTRRKAEKIRFQKGHGRSISEIPRYTPYAKTIKEKLCSQIYGASQQGNGMQVTLSQCKTEVNLNGNSHRVSPMKSQIERRETEELGSAVYNVKGTNFLLGYTQSKFYQKNLKHHDGKYLPKIPDQHPTPRKSSKLDFRQTFSKDLLSTQKLLEFSPQLPTKLGEKKTTTTQKLEELKKANQLPKMTIEKRFEQLNGDTLASTMETNDPKKVRNNKYITHSASHSVLQAFNSSLPHGNNVSPEKVASPHYRKMIPSTLQQKCHSMKKIPLNHKLKPAPSLAVKGVKSGSDKSPRYQNFRQTLKKNLQASLHSKV